MCAGENAHISCSYKRIASVGRIKTPRSPGRNTFESVEDSDEEGTQFGDDSRIPFYPVTRDVRIMISFFIVGLLKCYSMIFS